MDVGGGAAAARVVELINTRDCQNGDDVLADDRARAWLRGWLGDAGGGEGSGASVDARRLAELCALREGLRELAAGNNSRAGDAETVRRAAAVLRAVPVAVELGDDQTGPFLVARQAGEFAERAVVALAGAYLTARASGAWSRVKACASPGCRWGYLDASRNRSRRWCDMAECGNRAKNRAWRERNVVTGDAN